MLKQFNKLALGTVQFGLPYGVSNSQGQVPIAEVEAILNLALDNEVKTLDTAVSYGESEKVLGNFPLDEFEIITKLPASPSNCEDIQGWIDKELEGSLSRLNVSAVNGLLLHRPEELLSEFGHDLYRALQKKKEEGVVDRIGISIYSPDELEQLTGQFHFDLIQAPFNIIDNRLNDEGWFKRLTDEGTKIHVRSIFMQGLLLMPRIDRPAKFNRWSALWNLWDEWLRDTNITPLQACICHALSLSEIEKVVVGVDSLRQLNEILDAANGVMPELPSELRSVDIKLLNPSLWSQL